MSEQFTAQLLDWLLFALGMAWAFLMIELQYRHAKRKEGKK
jgi:hypothetical protein